MAKTKIEWCDYTWSPVSGCSKVSSGCQLCYAEAMTARFRKDHRPWTAGNAAHNVVLHPERLGQPLKWRKPRRVFIASMGDLFHEQVPDVFIDRVFAMMALAPRHTFQLLTKRPERMLDYMSRQWREEDVGDSAWNTRQTDKVNVPHDRCYMWPPPNCWLGISAEDQRTFDERVRWLLQTPAAVRFVSLEPLLAEINVREALNPLRELADSYKEQIHRGMFNRDQVDALREPTLDLVIAGSESGPGRRETDIDWVRSIRDQCVAANVPFFLKQMHIDGKKVSMPELDGRVWDEMPEVG